MKHSDSIKSITEALTKMHVSYGKDSKNPHFGNKYASISAILQAISVPLSENGLTVIQSPRPYDGNNIVVETRIIHTSGEWIETETFIPVQGNDPQKACSAITYGRRYGLEAAFGIAADDDDGETVRKQAQTPPKPVVQINFESLEKQLAKLDTEKDIIDFMKAYKASGS